MSVTGFADMGLYSVHFDLHLLRLGHGPQFVGVVPAAQIMTFAGAAVLTAPGPLHVRLSLIPAVTAIDMTEI